MNDRKKMMATAAVEMVITSPSLSHSLSFSFSLSCGKSTAATASQPLRQPHPKLSQNFQCGSTSIELSSLDGYEYELLHVEARG